MIGVIKSLISFTSRQRDQGSCHTIPVEGVKETGKRSESGATDRWQGVEAEVKVRFGL